MKFDAFAKAVITVFLTIEIMSILVSSMFAEGLITYVLMIAFCLATLPIVFRLERRA